MKRILSIIILLICLSQNTNAKINGEFYCNRDFYSDIFEMFSGLDHERFDRFLRKSGPALRFEFPGLPPSADPQEGDLDLLPEDRAFEDIVFKRGIVLSGVGELQFDMKYIRYQSRDEKLGKRVLMCDSHFKSVEYPQYYNGDSYDYSENHLLIVKNIDYHEHHI